MKYNADDPRITAYALGELEGDEVQAFEQALADDAALKTAVDEIRQTVGVLKGELASEETHALTDDQRSRIESGPHAGNGHTPVIYTIRRWWAPIGLAAAACLAVAVIVPLQLQREAETLSAAGKDDVFAYADKNEAGLRGSLDEEQVLLKEAPVGGQMQSASGPIPGRPPASTAQAQLEPKKTHASRSITGLSSKQESAPEDRLRGDDDGAQLRKRRAPAMDRTEGDSLEPPLLRSGERVGGARLAPGGGGLLGGGGDGGGAARGALGDESRDSLALPAQAPNTVVADGLADADESAAAPALNGVADAPAPEAPQVRTFVREKGITTLGDIKYSEKALSDVQLKEVEEEIANRLGRLQREPSHSSVSVDQLEELRQEVREITRRNEANREAYEQIVDNPFMRPTESPLSTLSIDVDTAAYSNIRRFVMQQNALPPKDAVRIEELINYFNYDYMPPGSDDVHPFSVHTEVNQAPWNLEHRLVKIGLKGREMDVDMRPATNLVFLLDVSGSMDQNNKLPLVKQSMKKLVERLTGDDRLAIVVYAGASGLVLDSTYCNDKDTIYAALENLHAGGSTNGGAGIELAYKVAAEHYIEGGVNRVLLCTDGDFNVGVSSDGSLVRLIEEKRTTGVFLSVLGFGRGNWQDAKMEKLTNAGNGNFAYIDSIREAEKVLVEDMAGTLVTIAKDVKIQVEFNPAKVAAYRLIGYENRRLAARDFNDDTKDAGEIGAGHTVTALYEVVPAGSEEPVEVAARPEVDDLKYQKPAATTEFADSDDLLTVKLRYKLPEGETSTKLEHPVVDSNAVLADASPDFRFSAAVASFGMILRNSPHKGEANLAAVLDLATSGKGADERGHRDEFMRMAEQAQSLINE